MNSLYRVILQCYKPLGYDSCCWFNRIGVRSVNGKVHLDVTVMKLCAVGINCISQNHMESNAAASTRNRIVEICFWNGSKCRATSLIMVQKSKSSGSSKGHIKDILCCNSFVHLDFQRSDHWPSCCKLTHCDWLAQLSLSHTFEVFYAVIGMEIKHIPPSQFPSKKVKIMWKWWMGSCQCV